VNRYGDLVLVDYEYVCSQCRRLHSLEEFEKNRFCLSCGKFLTQRNRRVLRYDNIESLRRPLQQMKNDNESSIETTYRVIQRSIPFGVQIDSLDAVKQVEEYRQYWKPKETNVILLAESHVFTDAQDYEIKLKDCILNRILVDYPLRFVRFVYCMGYGENELLTRVRSDRRNMGTPQYWKIFSSCIAENDNDLGFHCVLKTATRSFMKRLHNKVHVLRQLKEKGVWLLDASIVGLYGSGTKKPTMIEKVLEICWNNYLVDTITDVDPKHIIVIGKGVGNILNYKLRKITSSFTVIPQPQARGTSQWQLENYKNYQRICAKYC